MKQNHEQDSLSPTGGIHDIESGRNKPGGNGAKVTVKENVHRNRGGGEEKKKKRSTWHCSLRAKAETPAEVKEQRF